jgi:biotin-dependent carboxylase-like uncharacterized protein
MSLRVLRPGLQSLLVDFGRPRSRSLGVPIGGAADRAALALGNALVGNPPDAVALELCFSGPVLRATKPVACVVFGASFELFSSHQPLTVNRTFTLQADEELSIGGTSFLARAYLCVARGGFDAPQMLGSYSGLAPVQVGDVLPCLTSNIPHHRFAAPLTPAGARHLDPVVVWGDECYRLRVVTGPQADWFPEPGWYCPRDRFLFDGDTGVLTVSPASNRMGLRLQGPPFPVPQRELVSEAVCPGTVQVTRDGQCIVLGVDAQTIGGYPKIAQVISADLDYLGQLRPNDRVYFTRVDLQEAERLYREKQRRLKSACTRLRVAAAGL